MQDVLETGGQPHGHDENIKRCRQERTACSVGEAAINLSIDLSTVYLSTFSVFFQRLKTLSWHYDCCGRPADQVYAP